MAVMNTCLRVLSVLSRYYGINRIKGALIISVGTRWEAIVPIVEQIALECNSSSTASGLIFTYEGCPVIEPKQTVCVTRLEVVAVILRNHAE